MYESYQHSKRPQSFRRVDRMGAEPKSPDTRYTDEDSDHSADGTISEEAAEVHPRIGKFNEKRRLRLALAAVIVLLLVLALVAVLAVTLRPQQGSEPVPARPGTEDFITDKPDTSNEENPSRSNETIHSTDSDRSRSDTPQTKDQTSRPSVRPYSDPTQAPSSDPIGVPTPVPSAAGETEPTTNPAVNLRPTSRPSEGADLSRLNSRVPLSTAGPTPTLSPDMPTNMATASPIKAPTTSPKSKCDPYPDARPLPGKKGVAFTLREPGKKGSYVENMPKVIALKPYWNYCWGVKRAPVQPDNIEFVPMVWGRNGYRKLQEELPLLLEQGKVHRVLGFNEPDRENQSNMNVSEAVKLWPLLEKEGLPLASPSCADAHGEWMQEFMSSVDRNCSRVDYVGAHWYGRVNVENFKFKMTEIHQLYSRPVLLTEFAPADWKATTVDDNRFTRSQVLEFMKEVLPWMESQDWIAGYAWFPFKTTSPQGTCSSLFEADGTMTALGRFYASVNSSNPQGDQSISIDVQ